MSVSHLMRLEGRRLHSERGSWAALLVVGAVGLLAIEQGVVEVERQRGALAAVREAVAEQEAHLRNTLPADTDAGLAAYHLTFPVGSEPSPWAALALGQRDVSPFAHPLRLLGLVPQLHEAELLNPLSQLTGRLDLAFVLVFLLPLLVIALGHGVLSRDEELGTLALVRAQPVGLGRLVAARLAVRGVAVLLLALLLCVAGAVWAGAGVDGTLGRWLAVTAAYVLLWFLVVAACVCLRRSSSFNLVALTGVWMGWAILLPALLNGLVAAAHPLADGVALTLAQRMEVNDAWDRPRRDTLSRFFARRAEWASLQVPQERFSWTWYYAMHEVGDASVAPALATYHEALARRQAWAERAALALPPLNAQLLYTRLAGTDLPAHLAYQRSVASHHEALKGFLYPLVFHGERFARVDLSRAPRHHFLAAPGSGLPGGFWGLLAAVALLALGLPRGMRRLSLPAARL